MAAAPKCGAVPRDRLVRAHNGREGRGQRGRRMKLRTILSELPIGGYVVHDEAELGWDMVVSPVWGTGAGTQGVIRLGSVSDLAQDGAPATDQGLMLVYEQRDAQGDAGERDADGRVDPSCEESVVRCWGRLCPSDFQDAFLGLVRRSGELAARRNQLFECFLDSYDMRQFARKAASVLGNPVIISNTEHKVLAHAGELPTTDDVRSVLEAGYITPEVERHMREDGIISSVRAARHSIMSERSGEKDRCVTSIIYHHRLEMGRFDVFEATHRMTGLDLELVDFASDLAGIMIDRLGAAGGRLGRGSSILQDALEGTFMNEEALRAHLELLGLSPDDAFVLLRVLGPQDANEDYYARAGAIVQRTMPDVAWCVADGALVLLVSLGPSAEVGFDSYERCERRLARDRALAQLLENNDMRAYVCEPFADLASLRQRLGECRELCDAVPPADARSRVVYLWRHRFEVVAHNSELAGAQDMLLDKRVVAMDAYDREHGTSYLETAVASVRFPGSPADAAEALSVHRNTYFYRVNKIRDLFHVDLKDGDDRLAVSFSAAIMEGLAGSR
ncbi:MAG: PucR family transcriptional regulator [Coriobacteriaceae bacterium]|nr:MAG: PucR family transcriptional regulator [Coriobacteriaceae bacterium]